MRLSKTKITLFFSDSSASSRKAFTPLRSALRISLHSAGVSFFFDRGRESSGLFPGNQFRRNTCALLGYRQRCFAFTQSFSGLFIGRLYGSGYFKGIYLRRFSVFCIVFCRNWISKPLKQMPFFWCLTSFVCPKFFHLFPVFLLI